MTLNQCVESAVKAYLYRLISETGGCIPKMCSAAGVSRQTIYRYLHRAGITNRTGAYGRNGVWARRALRVGAAAEYLSSTSGTSSSVSKTNSVNHHLK